MRRVQAGDDPAAFARLVARWEQPIRRLCIRMTGDEHRGEDLTQEAFVRVFASRLQYDVERKFSTWLWRIALNLCHEEARRVGRRGERTIDLNAADDEPLRRAQGRPLRQAQGRPLPGPRPVDHDEPHGRAVRAERAQLVRVALQRLPEANRAVVVLREYENLKFREIAEVLDVPEGTVKWRMAQALVQLGEQLKPILGGDEAMVPVSRATKERLAL